MDGRKNPRNRKFKVELEDAEDGTLGICLACGEVQGGCEPDARDYECDSCGERRVYGIEEALVMGEVELEDEDGSDDPEERELENM